ncbi:MAG TPA: trypsin-like serine protease [Allosphingosinicella sp.]|nr:trypsin-like serine protease [Allosphingosinicella sp.]
MLIDIDIVKGRPVPAGHLRAVVALAYHNEPFSSCSGTLIAEDMVLTAAHCVCGYPPDRIFVGYDMKVTNGGSFVPASGWRAAYRCGVDTAATGVDIAILKVSRTKVTPMTAAPDALIQRANWLRIVGFGATDIDGERFEDRKLESAVPVTSIDCPRDVAEEAGCQVGEEIVAGTLGGPDTCSGDSGGPILISDRGGAGEYGEGMFRIAGVTSRGIDGEGTICGRGGVYERLTPAVWNWVSQAQRSLRRGT